MRKWTMAALLMAACTHQAAPNAPTGGTPPATATVATPSTEAPVVAPTPEAPTVPGVVQPPKPRPPKVKIIVRTIPSTPKAWVFWGKKKLGETPVTLERPRDSGPVDLIVKNDGFFPVHTRAYTFHNDVVYVRLTKLEDRMNLFGAKHDQVTTPAEGEPGALPPNGAPTTAPGAAIPGAPVPGTTAPGAPPTTPPTTTAPAQPPP